jgi:hypothetical protein
MLALFYMDLFVSFWGNKLSDKFMKATCEGMRWIPENVKMFSFEEYKEEILEIQKNENVRTRCELVGEMILESVAIVETPREIEVLPWDELGKEVFTMQEIEEATINRAVMNNNPEIEISALPYPNAVMVSRKKWFLVKEESVTRLGSFLGREINVIEKIAQEE